MRVAEHGVSTAAVVVLTYRRPRDVESILPLVVREAADCGVDCSVLVIDNDPQASAQTIAAQHPSVRYVHEPRPGIAAARNRALEECADLDAVAFIDDDERPRAGWLAELVRALASSAAAAVVGPVESVFSSPPEPWIVQGGFFDRPRFPTGTEVQVAATNNLVLDARFVRRHGLAFDEDFGLSGGSDTLFTRELRARGGRIVWCDEALVYDMVPTDRITRQWVLQRYYRSGNTWSRTTIRLSRRSYERAVRRLRLTAAGFVRVGGGALRWGVGSVLQRESQQAQGLRTLNRGLGMTAGAWGRVYSEYARA